MIRSGIATLIFGIFIYCTSQPITAQTKGYSIKLKEQTLDGLPIKAILYGKCDRIERVAYTITQQNDRKSTQEYFKGFAVQESYRMDADDWNTLKLFLLSADSYIVGPISSCYFVPEIAFEITQNKLSDQPGEVFILVSRSCSKLYISFSNETYSGSDGSYISLESKGYERINRLLEKMINPTVMFDDYYNICNNANGDPYYVENQLLLLDFLLSHNDLEAIQYAEKSNLLPIIESLAIHNGNLKSMTLAFQKTRFRNDRVIADDLLESGKISTLAQYIEKGEIGFITAPVPAELIDIPPLREFNPDAELAQAYLKRIGEIIDANPGLQKQFSVEKYLDYEKKKRIVLVEDQVIRRSFFIEYLTEESKKYR